MAAGKSTKLVGRRFGQLVVLEAAESYVGPGAKKRGQWRCLCDCGKTYVALGYRLLLGSTKSCGCSKERHGMCETRVYRIWKKMRERCTRKSNDNYARYGGRGITVCEKWLHSFSAFYADLGEPTTAKHTLDRINNDLGYQPGNCRWATYKEQAANKRSKGGGPGD